MEKQTHIEALFRKLFDRVKIQTTYEGRAWPDKDEEAPCSITPPPLRSAEAAREVDPGRSVAS
jgi:hypothetical protein